MLATSHLFAYGLPPFVSSVESPEALFLVIQTCERGIAIDINRQNAGSTSAEASGTEHT